MGCRYVLLHDHDIGNQRIVYEDPLGVWMKSWYVDFATGPVSNPHAPAIPLVKGMSWTFDFTDFAAVSFTGQLYLGDYQVQTARTGLMTIDGRQTFSGVVQTVSGVGTYDDATNTFTYSFMNGVVNGGGASTWSATSLSCVDGQTSMLGKVCITFATATPAWEGLTLNFVFSENRHWFTGSMQAITTGGSGLTRYTMAMNWHVEEIPLPSAAWLFGSGLLGLAGARRRRKPETN